MIAQRNYIKRFLTSSFMKIGWTSFFRNRFNVSPRVTKVARRGFFPIFVLSISHYFHRPRPVFVTFFGFVFILYSDDVRAQLRPTDIFTLERRVNACNRRWLLNTRRNGRARPSGETVAQRFVAIFIVRSAFVVRTTRNAQWRGRPQRRSESRSEMHPPLMRFVPIHRRGARIAFYTVKRTMCRALIITSSLQSTARPAGTRSRRFLPGADAHRCRFWEMHSDCPCTRCHINR